jgi:anthranilate synthase component I
VFTRRTLADDLTPIAAYHSLRRCARGCTFLFESAPGAGQAARHSIVGLGVHGELRVADGTVNLVVDKQVRREGSAARDGRVLGAARSLLDMTRPTTTELEHAPFLGAYGAAAFEFAGYVERLPQLPREDDPMPDLHLVVPETLIVFDHLTHELTISSFASATAVDDVRALLGSARIEPMPDAQTTCEPSQLPAALSYASAVLLAKEAILSGEAFQIVLAQRWTTPLTSRAFDVYRSLRAINPSPYMFFLDLGWGELFGSSPELLVTSTAGQARVRPLAGTRSRGADIPKDTRLAAQLLRDPKERAEHMMLVDLGRNDLARVCRTGSVRVSELLSIERYSHVMHLVSEVVGHLRAGQDAFDLFAAAFPAGTVSGAPKIRAMELIAVLEARRRGFYAGSVCRFGFDGSLDACITLRSAHAYGGALHLAAGAGIVAASQPEAEDAECQAKLGALIAAVERARSATCIATS